MGRPVLPHNETKQTIGSETAPESSVKATVLWPYRAPRSSAAQARTRGNNRRYVKRGEKSVDYDGLRGLAQAGAQVVSPVPAHNGEAEVKNRLLV